MKTTSRSNRAHSGGVLLSALAFTTITALLVAGSATIAVSHYARVRADADYQAALPLAEAGVNYELRKISLNTSSADQASAAGSVSLGGGSFTVYCTNKDGSSPWVAPNPLYITSSGTLNGVTRTVKISAKGFDWTGRFAVYAVEGGSTWHGSAASVVGATGQRPLGAAPERSRRLPIRLR